MTQVAEHYPRIDEFLIGYQPGLVLADGVTEDDKLIGIVKQPGTVSQRERVGSIFGMVENFGTASLVFEVLESSDNGKTDAYAAANIRVNGANVASVTVVPGGKVAFQIEGTQDDYLRFQATANAMGRLVVCTFGGQLDRRVREGTL